MLEDPQEQSKQLQRLTVVAALCMVFFFYWSSGQQQNNTVAPAKNEIISKEDKQDISKISTAKIEKFTTRKEAIESRKSTNLVNFSNEYMNFDVNLKSLQIDNLQLNKYYVEGTKNKVNLLSPNGAPNYAYIDFGWISGDKSTKLPDDNTIWKKETISKNKVKFSTIINGNKFEVILGTNNDYKYIIKAKMYSNLANIVPYARIKNDVTNIAKSNMNIHNGVVMLSNKLFNEISYSDVKDGHEEFSALPWIGFTDKYWFWGLISRDNENGISYNKTQNCEACYQVAITPKEPSKEYEFDIYVGPKELEEIEKYRYENNIILFDHVIDFGWFYFITKPILIFLKFLYKFFGNFGVAIIVLTICIRILLFPLAQKSYKSMSKLRVVGPRMQELKEKYKDDKKALNAALIELYKTEKINPAAGCFPLLLQIPVFFALYKVLSVSIEMRDAPFIFWITDLSDRDPTSIFNLFGLLPFGVPAFLQIGVLPILMGFTMYIQQKFSPPPTDPNQAKMMQFLPLIFTFMFASFPSGLVLYWSVNNILSILQQYFVQKKTV